MVFFAALLLDNSLTRCSINTSESAFLGFGFRSKHGWFEAFVPSGKSTSFSHRCSLSLILSGHYRFLRRRYLRSYFCFLRRVPFSALITSSSFSDTWVKTLFFLWISDGNWVGLLFFFALLVDRRTRFLISTVKMLLILHRYIIIIARLLWCRFLKKKCIFFIRLMSG